LCRGSELFLFPFFAFGFERFLKCLFYRKFKICKSVSLPVVLYGCETWSLILRKEHRLRVFENRVLKRIFGPKRNEVTGEWRKLHGGTS
jgi:hypothetical protein